MSSRVIADPTAFDAFAEVYDDGFTHSTLGQLLRPRVWEKLAQHFTAGQHILELTCGTGEDALWLAQRGVHVTATDGSAEMVKKAEAKAEAVGVRRRGEEARGRGSVEVEQISLQEVVEGYFGGRQSVVGGRFDGVFSNFGGLNTIGEWRALAEALAKMIKPGGKVILVPLGPMCPWEVIWYLAHGQPKMAFRRWARKGASAKIGDALIPIWYPSAGRLRTDFAPWFSHVETQSLELWLPPSYLDHFVNKWPGFFVRLNQFEKATACLTSGWGDHYIIVFKRN
ncbi:MAG: methyltransferase domain-containing protein [Chloroflexi bacterium]|nr:methyltransferase domain-containing protein [Chloroflexota bacterium]